jgi:hypothetical protein
MKSLPAPRTLSSHTGDVNTASTGVDLGSPFEKAAENEEAARLWISGNEALDRKLSKGAL